MAGIDIRHIGYSPDYYSQSRVKPSENFSTGQNIAELPKVAEAVMTPGEEDVSGNTGSSVSPVNLQELSKSFGGDAGLGMSGKESQILNLDIGKAVSDMQRDSVLQQYQYFVGEGLSAMNSFSEDGMVFQKFSGM